MVNRITNDLGKTVCAVGCEGSIARAACKWPRLIAIYESKYNATCHMTLPYSYAEAMDDLERCDKITCIVERKAILANTSIEP